MKNCYFLNVTNHERQLPYFLHGVGWDYDQENIYQLNGFEWYQLNICMKGRGKLLIKGMEFNVESGDALIIFPGVPYKYISDCDDLTVAWIAFDGFQVVSFLNSAGINSSGIYNFNNPQQISQLIKSLSYIPGIDLTGQGYEGSKAVYNLLLLVKKSISLEDKNSREYSIEKLKPALSFMKKNLREQISIEEIADSMEITPQHFCMLFKSVMNQRPFEYLNSLRINNAKNLLISSPELSIKKISMLSGYPNHNYFGQKFKKSERVTPMKFRELYRQGS